MGERERERNQKEIKREIMPKRARESRRKNETVGRSGERERIKDRECD